MCRWLAYMGPPIRLGDLLVRPNHSLIDQSLRATQNVETTNGDGFGVGWYGTDETPCVYRDTHPAWNDENYRNLSAHIRSSLFLSHVRAATGTPVQKTNCHPFRFENWLFQHNGFIPEFHQLKRRLMFDVDSKLFNSIAGSTDSEILFYLAITFGLKEDPYRALARTMGHVEKVRKAEGIGEPIQFSACVTDGSRLWSVRYSSNQQSRTQYHSQHIEAFCNIHGTYEPLPEGAVIVLSEPLDQLSKHWEKVPESSFVLVEDGKTTVSAFSPI